MKKKHDKIKIRRIWNINPETKIKENCKQYDREKEKRYLNRNLKNIDLQNLEELDDEF